MALTEQEEYEYLTLKKKKAMAMSQGAQQPSQPKPSVSTMGGSYLITHPFKTAFQDPVETVTGKSMLQRSQETPIKRLQAGKFQEPNFSYIPRATVQGTLRDAGALVGGAFASPASLATMGIGAIPVAGKTVAQVVGGAIAGTKIGKSVGGFLNQPIGQIGKNISQTTSRLTNPIRHPIQYAKDLIEGPSLTKTAGREQKFTLGQTTDITTRNLSKTANIKQTITERKYENIIRGYDELSDVLKKKIVKEGHREALNLQKQLPVLFRRKSLEFGAKRDTLIKGKGITVPANEVVGTMEEVLTYKGVLRFDEEAGRLITARSPMTPAEKQIYGLYKGTMRQLEENPGAVIDVEDILRAEKFAQPKFGKAWTPDDKLKANFSEKFSDAAEKYITGYKELKSDFAPYLQWKKQAIKETLPFSGKYETGKATGLISKIGSESLKPDEAHLLADLEKQIGRQVGGKIKTYQKGLKDIGEKQITIKEEAKAILDKMKQDASDEVFKLRQIEKITDKQIDNAVDKLVKQYRTRRIKLGVVAGVGFTILTGGNLLKYFFRREIYSGIHGGY